MTLKGAGGDQLNRVLTFLHDQGACDILNFEWVLLEPWCGEHFEFFLWCLVFSLTSSLSSLRRFATSWSAASIGLHWRSTSDSFLLVHPVPTPTASGPYENLYGAPMYHKIWRYNNREDCVGSLGDHECKFSRHIVTHAPCPFVVWNMRGHFMHSLSARM